jgi:hypothetical protein
MSSRDSRGVTRPAWRIDWDRVPSARPLSKHDEPEPEPEPSTAGAGAPPEANRPRRTVKIPSRPAESPSASPSPRPPAEAFLTPSARRARYGWRISPLVAGAVALLLAGAGVAAYLLIARTDEQPARTAGPGAARGQAHARKTFATRTDFEVGGVRFYVVPRPRQTWVSVTTASTAGPGQRWATVAVIYRNLSRKNLTAEGLRFRLQDSRGRLYLADAIVGNQGTEVPARARIPVGRLVHGELAYRVRTDAQALSLLVDVSPRQRIKVPLGAA